MTALPDIVAHEDGHVHTLLIAEPCFLFAWRTTAMATGLTWLSVYRSSQVREHDELYQPVTDLIGEADLLRSETVEDENMLCCEAELAIYGSAA